MTRQLTTLAGEITIRLATPADAEQLRLLRLEALEMHPEAFATDYAKTAAESVEMWAQSLEEYATSESSAISLACAGDQLIGMAGIGRERWPKTQHSAWIWGVFLKPEWRGNHIAEAILEELFAWAHHHGVIQLLLGVITTNTQAIRFYSRCGFTVYGIEAKVIYCASIFYDELLMKKSLE